ncbi:glucokinase [Mucilaginibacter gossypiicola]|uniref:Glucokinase n=1 Tax=Mucilaginibacter gossypiicola TaxID=551995 RepID=A0A1H8LNZ9_9SPHI|nr:ROK family protein [Mucilaginibacter gossypiicola]SEO06839.1 glucokinase [Mucilaginibacter gossypiicola]
MTENTIYSPYILCADVGGSHITCGICDLTNNTILEHTWLRADVNCHGNAEEILTSWSGAFKAVLESSKLTVAGISIAMPGPFDYDQGTSYITGLHKYESIYNVNIRAYLAETLHISPSLIKFRNDAEATILGECIAGAGMSYHSVMGITLGTGFGSAQLRNQIMKDLNLGSVAYRDTIADDYFSTRWFVKRFNELTGQTVQNVKELTLLKKTNSEVAVIFYEFGKNLGSFLQTWTELLGPEILVICGNIAKASDLFLPALKSRLDTIDIEIAHLGENAPLIGAAALFNNMEKSFTPFNYAKK